MNILALKKASPSHTGVQLTQQDIMSQLSQGQSKSLISHGLCAAKIHWDLIGKADPAPTVPQHSLLPSTNWDSQNSPVSWIARLLVWAGFS